MMLELSIEMQDSVGSEPVLLDHKKGPIILGIFFVQEHDDVSVLFNLT